MVFLEELLSFLIEIILFKLLILIVELTVLWEFELSSEIQNDALQQIESILVEVVNHNAAMSVPSLVHRLHLIF
jgi:hypothetical protein